jgi:predicted deacylase
MMFERFVIEGKLDGPRLLITAGVHGDEFEPMLAVGQLANELRDSVLRGTVVLIPVVNESAYARGMRCGEDGLDLARTCPGAADGSVTERVAHALTAEIRAADYYIDLHTGGAKLRLLPLTGYMLHADAAVLNKQREMAAAFGLPIVWGTSPELEGRSLSVARDARVPAIYAEHGGVVFDQQVIADYRHGCQRVMHWMQMADCPTPPPPTMRRVEDDRPQSGHLQIKCPAPSDGLFVTTVELGTFVKLGDALGHLIELPSGKATSVNAECRGRVLMLHASTRVQQGTGLAVVLDEDWPGWSSQ